MFDSFHHPAHVSRHCRHHPVSIDGFSSHSHYRQWRLFTYTGNQTFRIRVGTHRLCLRYHQHHFLRLPTSCSYLRIHRLIDANPLLLSPSSSAQSFLCIAAIAVVVVDITIAPIMRLTIPVTVVVDVGLYEKRAPLILHLKLPSWKTLDSSVPPPSSYPKKVHSHRNSNYYLHLFHSHSHRPLITWKISLTSSITSCHSIPSVVQSPSQ